MPKFIIQRVKNRLSLQQLRIVWQELSGAQNEPHEREALILEGLQLLVEIVVWGDQNDCPEIFEFAMENQFMAFLRQLLCQDAPISIYKQGLQVLCIFFESLKTPTSLFYILSENHVNDILSFPFPLELDEELLGYYISFMKMLSHRLNPNTVALFWNEHQQNFPLYTEAVKLFEYPDAMVRTSVRNLILLIFQVKEEVLQDYVRVTGAPHHLSQLVKSTAKISLQLDAALRSGESGLAGGLIVEHLDLFQYMNDLMVLPQLADDLRKALLEQLFVPLYCGSLITSEGPISRHFARPLSTATALFILAQALNVFEDSPFLHAIVATLLYGRSDYDIAQHEHSRYASDDDESEDERPSDREADKEDHSSSRDDDKMSGSIFFRPIIDCLYTAEQRCDTEALPALMLLSSMMENPNVSAAALRGRRLEFMAPDGAIGDYNQQLATALLMLMARASTLAPDMRLPSATNDDKKEDNVPQYRLITLTLAIRLLNMLTTPVSSPTPTRTPRRGSLTSNLSSPSTQMSDATSLDGGERTGSAPPSVNGPSHMLLRSNAVNRFLVGSSSPTTGRAASRSHLLDSDSCCRLIPEHQYIVMRVAAMTLKQLKDMYTIEMTKKEDRSGKFLDIFELEHKRLQPLRLVRLLSSATVVMPPTSKRLPGVDFELRLPATNDEKLRRSIQVCLVARKFYFAVIGEHDKELPLAQPDWPVAIRDTLPFNKHHAIIPCFAITTHNGKTSQTRVMLSFDEWRLIVLEHSTINHGIVRLHADLSCVHVEKDSSNTRGLVISVYERPRHPGRGDEPQLVHTAKYTFSDHIKCYTAAQLLETGRKSRKDGKLGAVARLLSGSYIIEERALLLAEKAGFADPLAEALNPLGDAQPASSAVLDGASDDDLEDQSRPVSTTPAPSDAVVQDVKEDELGGEYEEP